MACVASEDAFVTMHWMVQCVPDWKEPLTYHCPEHLPQLCDAERVQEPCDTSALGHCDADTCKAGSMPKQLFPAFCQLGKCTQSECCDACPEASLVDGRCRGADGARVPDTCCAEPESGSEWDTTPSCDDRILALAEPTTARMQAYQSVCMFNPSDVDMGAPRFALTAAGRAKLCEAPCQAEAVLANAPEGIWGIAQNLASECSDPALTSQISPVGLFAAANELDSVWRACGGGGASGGGGGGAAGDDKDNWR